MVKPFVEFSSFAYNKNKIRSMMTARSECPDVVRGGTWWYAVVHGGTRWYVVVPGGTRWYAVVRGGTRWYMVMHGLKLCTV